MSATLRSASRTQPLPLSSCAAFALLLALLSCGDGDDSTGPDDGAPAGPVPHAVQLTPESAEVIAGWQRPFSVLLLDPEGGVFQGEVALSWTSSDPSVATVDAEGRVRGLRPGTATIRARVPGTDRGDSARVDVVPETLRRVAAERGFWIGAAVGYGEGTFPANAPYVETLRREFNALAPENVMKWQTLRRDGRDSWRFRFTDELVAFAEANGMRVRGHVLAWHAQNPAWLDELTPERITRAEAIALLEEHIRAVMERYRGKIRDYDVVNEAIRDGATGAVGGPEDRRPASESVWERVIGPDWIEVAFRAAGAADPEARLFYNDYGIEVPFSDKQDRVYHLVADLLSKGVPIHGVGFQSHFVLGSTPTEAQLRQSIDRFAGLRLVVQITELDIRVPAERQNAEGFAQQAEEFRRVVRVCREHPACDMVVVWGVDDGHSWRSADRPTLFDASFQPKPGYAAVVGELAEPRLHAAGGP